MVTRFSRLQKTIALGFHVVCDASFDRRFGTAIGVRGADWADFRNWDHVFEAGGIAIDGGRRGKNNVGYIVACHGGQEADGAVDIGTVVL